MKSDQDARYSVVELCLALGVSRSGFYDHEQKPDCERRREDGVLAQKISLLFLEGRRTYGSRRIQKGLLREGIQCGKKRIVRLMRDQKLEVIQRRAFRPKTTQSCHDQPIAPNRLKALPEPSKRPNEVWCADITYIPSKQDGWLYSVGWHRLCRIATLSAANRYGMRPNNTLTNNKNRLRVINPLHFRRNNKN